MRVVDSEKIIEIIESACIRANTELSPDVYNALKAALNVEESVVGREILSQIIQNADAAKEEAMPICQDTGMAVFFVELGKDVHIEGSNLTDAINEGVRRGYEKGYLRKSVVGDPIGRINTKDNTPAVIYYEMTDGDKIIIDFTPKGFGSENMSRLKMLKPSDSTQGIIDFVIDVIRKGGANPCPPVIVGVGIGGTMDKAAVLAKKALLRDLGRGSDDDHIRRLEDILKEKINDLGIGPAGLGGRVTALGVNILVYPTHIAGLPVAVNICCHASRHLHIEI
jgi:fumarate hydratase subunit alpha